MIYWVLVEYDGEGFTTIRGVTQDESVAVRWARSGTDCSYEGPFLAGDPDS